VFFGTIVYHIIHRSVKSFFDFLKTAKKGSWQTDRLIF